MVVWGTVAFLWSPTNLPILTSHPQHLLPLSEDIFPFRDLVLCGRYRDDSPRKYPQIGRLMKSSRANLPPLWLLSSATLSCLFDALLGDRHVTTGPQQHRAPEQLVIDLPDPTDRGKMLRE